MSKIIGNIIRIRENKGLTQQFMAKELGIT